MNVLAVLTLVYAAVLVTALAVSLVLILIRLRRIANALGAVEAALTRVRDSTTPLERYLGRLQQAAALDGASQPTVPVPR